MCDRPVIKWALWVVEVASLREERSECVERSGQTEIDRIRTQQNGLEIDSNRSERAAGDMHAGYWIGRTGGFLWRRAVNQKEIHQEPASHRNSVLGAREKRG